MKPSTQVFPTPGPDGAAFALLQNQVRGLAQTLSDAMERIDDLEWELELMRREVVRDGREELPPG
jgi:hypothetical protein